MIFAFRRRAAVLALGLLVGWGGAAPASAEEIGEVTTVFKLLGANHRIAVEAFDDPKVEGVACFLSRARTGGIRGSLGLAEDTSDASVACRQVGPIRYKERLNAGEEVFQARTSILFKTMQVVRFYDPKRKTLVYLVYSDKIIEGSPKNAISAVAVQPWGPSGAEPEPPDYRD